MKISFEKKKPEMVKVDTLNVTDCFRIPEVDAVWMITDKSAERDTVLALNLFARVTKNIFKGASVEEVETELIIKE